MEPIVSTPLFLFYSAELADKTALSIPRIASLIIHFSAYRTFSLDAQSIG
jgi:hypothetical protein